MKSDRALAGDIGVVGVDGWAAGPVDGAPAGEDATGEAAGALVSEEVTGAPSSSDPPPNASMALKNWFAWAGSTGGKVGSNVLAGDGADDCKSKRCNCTCCC